MNNQINQNRYSYATQNLKLSKNLALNNDFEGIGTELRVLFFIGTHKLENEHLTQIFGEDIETHFKVNHDFRRALTLDFLGDGLVDA